MKKTYIAPNCKIRMVQKCNIIATSFGSTNERMGNAPEGGFGRDGWWDDDDDE